MFNSKKVAPTPAQSVNFNNNEIKDPLKESLLNGNGIQHKENGLTNENGIYLKENGLTNGNGTHYKENEIYQNGNGIHHKENGFQTDESAKKVN